MPSSTSADNFIKSLVLIVAFILFVIFFSISNTDRRKKVFQYLRETIGIDKDNWALVSYDNETGIAIVRHKRTNEERSYIIPREIPNREEVVTGSKSSNIAGGSGTSAGAGSNSSIPLSRSLSAVSRDLTSQLREHFVSLNSLNVRNLTISERLRTAEHELDYFADWIDPVTQTYQMAFITDRYMEEFIKISKEYILKIQTNILDTVTEDFGATTQQVEQRRRLNRKATKIIEMLESRSPRNSPRYRS